MYRSSRILLLATASIGAMMIAAPVQAQQRLERRTVDPSAAAARAAQAQAQQRLVNAQRSRATFERVNQARRAAEASQAAARAAAQARASTMPNGLGRGGLQVADGAVPGSTLWQGADAPTQTVDANGRVQVRIGQNRERAILNWASFNVGRDTDLTFDQQGNASWAVLNRVLDASPSQIQGSIRADGTVLILNQNGLLFSGTAQVNTRNLLAAAGRMSDEQFTTRGIYSQQSGGAYIPSITETIGAVRVEAGARLATNAPTSVLEGGGYVNLMGADVEQGGTITSPKGQVLLAAGDSFLIRRGLATVAAPGDESSIQSTTRGNEVQGLLSAGSSSGYATNSGLIVAEQGDITLTGHQVVQAAVAVSSTSVNQRGTVHLLNSATDTAGLVRFAPGSVTAVLPEIESAETALDAQRDALLASSGPVVPTSTEQFNNYAPVIDRRDQSRIEIASGGDVLFDRGSGTVALGGQVEVDTVRRVQVEPDALIDVSGVRGVSLAAAANVIQVDVQGNELRDNALNRESRVLFNADVWIDLRNLVYVPAGTNGYATDRYYTAGGLLEVSGYVANNPHKIGEWTAGGGSVALRGREVVVRSGSTIDLSGGTVDYASGIVPVTQLRGSDGRLYDVNEAPGALLYTGIGDQQVVGQSKWGFAEIYSSPFSSGTTGRREPARTVGRDAGRLTLVSPTILLEGTLRTDVVVGETQNAARSAGADSYRQSQAAVPLSGGLRVGAFGNPSVDFLGAIGTDVRIADIADAATVLGRTDPLPANRVGTTWLNASLANGGLGSLFVATNGNMSIEAPLVLADGGSLHLSSPNLLVAADLTVRSGDIRLGNLIGQAPGSGDVVIAGRSDGASSTRVAGGVTIDTRGRWTNLFLDPFNTAGLAFADGGAVSLETTQDLTIENGAVIDASSGGGLLADGSVVEGRGGDVSLTARTIRSGILGSGPAGTGLVFQGTLRSYGMREGGHLTLAANYAPVWIGAVSTTTPDGAFVVDPQLFGSGFSSYEIVGGSLTVAAGTSVDVTMPVLRSTGSSLSTASRADPNAALELWMPPAYLEDPARGVLTRRGGADLMLRTEVAADYGVQQLNTGAVTRPTLAPLTLEPGSSLRVDDGRSVSLAAYGQLTVDGTITAHGGTIDLAKLDFVSGLNAFDPQNVSVWLGPRARLDASGRAVTALDRFGRTYGLVQDGGLVRLHGNDDDTYRRPGATEAYIILRPGSAIDVSGAVATLDASAGLSPQRNSESMLIAADGGTVSLSTISGFQLDGTLSAARGGAGAANGTLEMSLLSPVYPLPSDRREDAYSLSVQALRQITLTQAATPSILGDLAVPGTSAEGLVLGSATISAAAITRGGFGNLALRASDVIGFDGDLDLRLDQSLMLGAATLSATTPGQRVALEAPHVLLDGWKSPNPPVTEADRYFGLTPFFLPDSVEANHALRGSQISITADLLDVRDRVSFGILAPRSLAPEVDSPGFENVTLRSRGDLRMLGSTSVLDNVYQAAALRSRGQLDLFAGQIYATTRQLTAVSAPSIRIGRGGELPSLPMSAFGGIAFVADTIEQGGVVRAPLGVARFLARENLTFLPGSITSTSGAGLVMPFGGTPDDLNYFYDGKTIDYLSVADALALLSKPFSDFDITREGGAFLQRGVVLDAPSMRIDNGATIDVTGGGELRGASFVTGRGGSTNVLAAPYLDFSPAPTTQGPAARPAVYAIVPGYGSAYAPAAAENGAGDPMTGRHVTIGADVPGLPAGTYTLLPSNYALLPGAFRVEIGEVARIPADPASAPSGVVFATGKLGVANTQILDAFETDLKLTPASLVRQQSGFNETRYSKFAEIRAATFGTPRPLLERDAQSILLRFAPGDAIGEGRLSLAGQVRMTAAAGGFGGTLAVTTRQSVGSSTLEILGDQAPTEGFYSVRARDLNAFGASTLMVGGFGGRNLNLPQSVDYEFNATFGAGRASGVVLRDGADLAASQIFLISGGEEVRLEGGALVDTRGRGSVGWDFSPYNIALSGIALSNGAIFVNRSRFSGLVDPTERVVLEDGSALRSDGVVVLLGPAGTSIGDVDFVTRDLNLVASSINLGSVGALASAEQADLLPSGWTLDPTSIDRLIGRAPGSTTRIERLSLTASQSVNFYGSVALDTTGLGGRSVELALNTPAIYGLGTAGDAAVIRTGRFVWNGVRIGSGASTSPYASATPGAVLPGGAGNGAGRLMIAADEILFGYPANSFQQSETVLNRITLGFGSVELTATQRITANSNGSLSVNKTGDRDAALVMSTPLLTAEAGARMALNVGGALRLSGTGSPADLANVAALGGELRLTAAAMSLDSAVALPTGRLVLNATGDIVLGDAARIDLSGRQARIFDAVRPSWGGDLVMESAGGNILQAAGGTIDVSAKGADAGSVQVTATGSGSRVELAGKLAGGADVGFERGAIDMRAATLADFAGLNRRLNDGGVTGGRSFLVKTGDLTIGDELRANSVSVSVDGGSLTVSGRIDGRGEKAGTIRLAARDDLVLTSSAVLDTRASTLVKDALGEPIGAMNRGGIELTASTGRLVMAAGATLDLAAPDNVARGMVNLNAPRIGSDDIGIDAAGALNIRGAESIALNGFRTYSPDDGIVTQALLDDVHADSVAFIDAALANSILRDRIAGLAGFGGTFHIRPGVEVRSSGDMRVRNDVDLSGYRYGPAADASLRGSGEPGTLVLRASEDLLVAGSISDGFAPPPATPDDNGWRIVSAAAISSPITVVDDATLAAGAVLPGGASQTQSTGFAFTARQGATVRRVSGLVIPFEFVSNAALNTTGWVAAANIFYPNGTVVRAGQAVTTAPPAGSRFAAGSILPQTSATSTTGTLAIRATVIPAGTPLNVFGSNVTVDQIATVPAGGSVPVGTSNVNLATRPTVGGRQGQIFAVAPMLAPGSLSWSMRVAAGADLGSADSRSLRASSNIGSGGDLVLADLHFSSASASNRTEAASVLRTGTGNLDLLAAGSFLQRSLFGIYTAGTQTNVDASYTAPRARFANDTLVGSGFPAYDAIAAGTRTYFPDHGGDLLLRAQGKATGYTLGSIRVGDTPRTSDSNDVARWLWRQGGAGTPTSWSINFGTYAIARDATGLAASGGVAPELMAFAGLGTLGGGNTAIRVEGDAGLAVGDDSTLGRSNAINLVVAATGYVRSDASLVQSGGGALDVAISGSLNDAPRLGGGGVPQSAYGVVAALRGSMDLQSGSLGRLALGYGVTSPDDPRPADIFGAAIADAGAGIRFVVGDAPATVRTLRALVVQDAPDAGRLPAQNAVQTNFAGQAAGQLSWFSLWTDRSSLSMYSAGGNAVPSLTISPDYPGTFRLIAPSGNIYAGAGPFPSALPNAVNLDLAPSRAGQLELIAGGSLYLSGLAADFGENPIGSVPLGFNMSGANPRVTATPTRPGYVSQREGAVAAAPLESNAYLPSVPRYSLYQFGANTVTGPLHESGAEPIFIYAGAGDIVNLRLGSWGDGTIANINSYLAAKPAAVRAGRDIVAIGRISSIGTEANLGNFSGFLTAHNGPSDITTISAGRDILYAHIYAIGPGTLDIQAGRNIYQGETGTIRSLGQLYGADSRNRTGGAAVSLTAGVGTAGPDYAGFLGLYLDPANRADPERPLADQPGLVVKTYEAELLDWLMRRFGFSGDPDQALDFFNELPSSQQAVFGREVYFEELRAGGREYNDPTSRRFNSYLRGRNAAAALLPASDAYRGDITMFSGSRRVDQFGRTVVNRNNPVPARSFDSLISTDFGGDVEVLVPGGAFTIGVENVLPSASSGVLTQGSGNIRIYSEGSVNLGLSRVFTTFGGDITIWSAAGDIAAGRGAKGTVLFAPARRVYDQVGNVALSPTAPTSGAGIATLAPISEVPPGDIDLIAPLGTVDAGEAGIRVSGDLNIAALRVVNAANIQVQGDSAGIPQAAAVNVGALTTAGNAAAAVSTEAERLAERARPAMQPQRPTIITARLLGFGEQ